MLTVSTFHVTQHPWVEAWFGPDVRAAVSSRTVRDGAAADEVKR
jgi:hypothetical protein